MEKIKILIKSIKLSLSLFYKTSRLWISVYFLLSITASTLGIASTYALKNLINSLTADSTVLKGIVLYAIVYIVILILVECNNSIQNIVYDFTLKKAEHLYESNLSKKLAELPLSIIDSSEGKDLANDAKYAKNTVIYLTYQSVRVFTMAYTFTIAFSALVAFNFWFSFILLGLSVPGIILLLIYDRKSENLRRKQAPDVRKFCYYRWMLTDPWPAKDVRMYNLTDHIQQRYNEVKGEYILANKRLDKKKLFSMLCAETILRLGEIVFTFFVVLKSLSGEIGIGDVSLYIGLALTAVSSFENFMHIALMTFTGTIDIISRVFDFYDIAANSNSGTRTLDKFKSLELKNVCFKYPHTDDLVLKGVSFKLEKGDKLSIVGINGSGKSTIIKLILGLYELQSGYILINGYPMSDYDIRDVRKMYSVLFQDFVKYPLTLRDNVALSDYDRASDDSAVISSLKQGGIYEELQGNTENGLDSFMTKQFDDKGIELSKGQWQKIAISRAYFKNADVLIFDEPSSALDADAEDKMINNLKDMSDGKTCIMISHRMSAARMSNKIIVIDNGVITECGSHNELMAANGLYAKLYNLQKEKYTVR